MTESEMARKQADAEAKSREAEVEASNTGNSPGVTQYTESEIRQLKVDEARRIAVDNFEEPEGFRFAKANQAEMHEFLIMNLDLLNAILRGEDLEAGIPGTEPPATGTLPGDTNFSDKGDGDVTKSTAAKWLKSDEAQKPNPATDLA